MQKHNKNKTEIKIRKNEEKTNIERLKPFMLITIYSVTCEWEFWLGFIHANKLLSVSILKEHKLRTFYVWVSIELQNAKSYPGKAVLRPPSRMVLLFGDV